MGTSHSSKLLPSTEKGQTGRPLMGIPAQSADGLVRHRQSPPIINAMGALIDS
jgi:hypothetical protein